MNATLILRLCALAALLAPLALMAQAAPLERYLDTGDGVVADQSLGLEWMKCAAGQEFAGRLCRGTARPFAWQDAVRHCESLRLAGRSDWRAPSLRELQTLADRSRTAPMLNLDLLPAPYPYRFWSAATQPDERGAVGVAFNFMEGVAVGDAGANFVRCVRGPALADPPR
jgi:Protein of unknown function (DUF1566)